MYSGIMMDSYRISLRNSLTDVFRSYDGFVKDFLKEFLKDFLKDVLRKYDGFVKDVFNLTKNL